MKEFVYGRHVVAEVIQAGKRAISEIWVADASLQDKDVKASLSNLSIKPQIVPRKKLDDLTKGANHQGIVAFVESWAYTPLEKLILQKPKVVVVCDSITDPHNLGAIARAMRCFNAEGLVLNKDHSCGVTPTVMKSSAGAIENLTISLVINISRALEDLKQAGYWVYAASLNATETLPQIKWADYVVIVLGNEGEGIRPLVLKNSDVLFKIPQKGNFDSLNVSQAASVILYEINYKEGIS
ncbi:MAG: hypothetical protein ACD_73C00783G0002 [uncultured bacterium]|nr:MAG: hypothetical protein ACD_73C00783G0002 [uncultured bacterium]